MQDTIARLASGIIPLKRYRKFVRDYLAEFGPLRDRGFIRKFAAFSVRPKSVLLVEANECHTENLPGVADYFISLGYNVDALVYYKRVPHQPFCRFPEGRVNVFAHSHFTLGPMLQSGKISLYEYVFLASGSYYNWGETEDFVHSFQSWFGFLPSGRFGSMVMEHDAGDIDRHGNQQLAEEGRVFTIASIPWRGAVTRMLNPHGFGRVAVTAKRPGTTNFIAVGRLTARKDGGLLVDAVESLVASGLRNFTVTLVGSGQRWLERKIPPSLLPHFRFMGKLSYPEMFLCVEEADFFLPLLNSHKKEHTRFMTTGATGTMQLVLGFAKPPVLDGAFAGFYRMTEKSCICYEPGSLADGMRRAMSLTEEEYTGMQGHVLDVARAVREESLDNLRESIRGIEGKKEVGI